MKTFNNKNRQRTKQKFSQYKGHNSTPKKQDRKRYNPRKVEPTKNPADVDTDAVLASITGRMVKLRPGETSEQLIKRFKTIIEKSGLMKDIKRKEFHKSKGELRREKALKARKRARQRLKKQVRK